MDRHPPLHHHRRANTLPTPSLLPPSPAHLDNEEFHSAGGRTNIPGNYSDPSFRLRGRALSFDSFVMDRNASFISVDLLTTTSPPAPSSSSFDSDPSPFPRRFLSEPLGRRIFPERIDEEEEEEEEEDPDMVDSESLEELAEAANRRRRDTINGLVLRKEVVGPWVLGKTLGGGMAGSVRLAKHSVTGEKVAIKIVSKHRSGTEKLEVVEPGVLPKRIGCQSSLPSRVEKEIAILKLMDHPNIVRYHEAWESEAEVFIVLEHVKGGELFGFINDEKEISERRAMRMFRQIVSAVYHCHMINISHRDIKPENIILMDDHATIKVADFGLSALYSQDWELSTSCGSPFYAAPEILKGQRYSGRKVDVYACGVVLYALLARRLPYGEHSTRDLLKVMQTSTFELPRGISSGVEDLVRRMMEQDPRRRITMREVWCHPQFQFYSGNLPLPKGPWNCIDLAPPIIASAYDVDLETIGNLRALHGIEHDTVIHQLSSNKPNGLKMLYVLLVSYRSKHPECYPRLTKEETKAGEKIARLLEESASKSAGIQRCLSSAPFSYYTPSIMAKFDEEESDYQEDSDQESTDTEEESSSPSRLRFMHGNQASLHLPLVYRGIYGDVGPFEQRSRLPEPMENGSDASLISHHEVPDAGETATALITFPEISEESDVSIVYPEIVDESDVTVVYPDIGDDSEMTITSPTIGRDDSFFQTPTYYRHVYISNSSVGYVEDVRESSVLTSESRKLLFPRQMSDIHSPDGVPESSTEARFRTWDESVVNGSNPWNESAVQFTPTRTLLSASRPNYEAENSHLVGPIDENLNRHLNRHRHRRRTSVLSSRPSFMYHRLSVQPVTPVRSSRHNHRRSQIVGLPKTRQRSSTAIERGKAKKEGVNEASQQDSEDWEDHTEESQAAAGNRRPLNKLAPVQDDTSIDFSTMAKRRSRELERFCLEQNHWNRASQLTGYEVFEEDPGSPNSMAGAVGTPGNKMNRIGSVFSEVSVETTYELGSPENFQSPRNAVHGGSTDGQNFEETVFEGHDEVLQDLRNRLSELSFRTSAAARAANAEAESQPEAAENVAVPVNELAGEPAEEPIRVERAHAPTSPPSNNYLRVPSDSAQGQFGYQQERRHSAPNLLDDSNGNGGPSRGSLIATLGRKTLSHFKSKERKAGVAGLFEEPEAQAADATAEEEAPTGNHSDGSLEPFVLPDLTIEDDSDEELDGIKRNEFKRVCDKRSWIQKVLKKIPPTRIICFIGHAAGTRETLLDLLREWKKWGVQITQDDKKGLVVRATIADQAALKIKQLHLVAEIRVTAGRRKFGTCAARFTLEKGSEASFHKVCEQIYKTFHEWTLVETDGRAVSRMEKAFRV